HISKLVRAVRIEDVLKDDTRNTVGNTLQSLLHPLSLVDILDRANNPDTSPIYKFCFPDGSDPAFSAFGRDERRLKIKLLTLIYSKGDCLDDPFAVVCPVKLNALLDSGYIARRHLVDLTGSMGPHLPTIDHINLPASDSLEFGCISEQDLHLLQLRAIPEHTDHPERIPLLV